MNAASEDLGAEASPRVLRMHAAAPDLTLIAQAARLLRRGGLVAFPTETVYGLGADATNPQALARLNRVKERPPDKPYSLHVASVAQARALAPTMPPAAVRLMERFCPGPLTLVIPSADGHTVGLRIPDHPVALAFLAACEVPVVAPSANRSGAAPPTTAQQVLDGLGAGFECLLDAGPTRFGCESTVVEVLDGRLVIRREGALSAAELLRVGGLG